MTTATAEPAAPSTALVQRPENVAELMKLDDQQLMRLAAYEARKALVARKAICQAILHSGFLGKAVSTVAQVNALMIMSEARGMNVVEAVCGQAIYATDDGQVGYYASFLAREINRIYGDGSFKIALTECDRHHSVAYYHDPGFSSVNGADLVERVECWIDPERAPHTEDGDLQPGIWIVRSSLLKGFGWQQDPMNQLQRYITRKVCRSVFPRALFSESSAQVTYLSAMESLPDHPPSGTAVPSAAAISAEAGSDEYAVRLPDDGREEAASEESDEPTEAEFTSTAPDAPTQDQPQAPAPSTPPPAANTSPARARPEPKPPATEEQRAIITAYHESQGVGPPNFSTMTENSARELIERRHMPGLGELLATGRLQPAGPAELSHRERMEKELLEARDKHDFIRAWFKQHAHGRDKLAQLEIDELRDLHHAVTGSGPSVPVTGERLPSPPANTTTTTTTSSPPSAPRQRPQLGHAVTREDRLFHLTNSTGVVKDRFSAWLDEHAPGLKNDVPRLNTEQVDAAYVYSFQLAGTEAGPEPEPDEAIEGEAVDEDEFAAADEEYQRELDDETESPF